MGERVAWQFIGAISAVTREEQTRAAPNADADIAVRTARRNTGARLITTTFLWESRYNLRAVIWSASPARVLSFRSILD